MPSREYTGGVSRSVHQNNMKKGAASQYHKTVVSSKVPMKFKKPYVPPKPKPTVTLDDVVIKAKPPKKVMSKETRYTIPDVPVNGNIATQTYIRSHTKMAVILNEFKTNVKVKNFNEDCDHEIEVLK